MDCHTAFFAVRGGGSGSLSKAPIMNRKLMASMKNAPASPSHQDGAHGQRGPSLLQYQPGQCDQIELIAEKRDGAAEQKPAIVRVAQRMFQRPRHRPSRNSGADRSGSHNGISFPNPR